MESTPRDELEVEDIRDFLEDTCTLCPVCHEPCDFTVSTEDGGNITIESDCGSCGKRRILQSFDGAGDLLLTVDGTGEEYEPYDECYCILSRVGDTAPADSDIDALEDYEDLVQMYLSTYRPCKALDLVLAVADAYVSHIGQDGWDDAAERCISLLIDFFDDDDNYLDDQEIHDYSSKYLRYTDTVDTSLRDRYRGIYYMSSTTDEQISSAIEKLRDELKSESRSLKKLSPRDMIRLASRYGLLSILYQKVDDYGQGLDNMKTCFDLFISAAPSGLDDDTYFALSISLSRYVELCYFMGKTARIREAIRRYGKAILDFCGSNGSYLAHSFFLKACLLHESDLPLTRDTYDEMESLIDILEDEDSPEAVSQLAIAYFFHFLSSPHQDLDRMDISVAFDLILEAYHGNPLEWDFLVMIVKEYIGFLRSHDPERLADVLEVLQSEDIKLEDIVSERFFIPKTGL